MSSVLNDLSLIRELAEIREILEFLSLFFMGFVIFLPVIFPIFFGFAYKKNDKKEKIMKKEIKEVGINDLKDEIKALKFGQMLEIVLSDEEEKEEVNQ